MVQQIEGETSPPDEELHSKSWIVSFIFFLVILVLVIYYFAEIKKDVSLLEKINVYWLGLAFFAQFITYYSSASIYRLLLKLFRPVKIPPLKELIKASVTSLFFNQLVPSAGLSGNTFFFSFFSRYGLAADSIILLILVELLIFYAAMEAIMILLLLASLTVYSVPHIFIITLLAGLLVYFLLGVFVTLAQKGKFLRRLYDKLKNTRFIKKRVDRMSSKKHYQQLSTANGKMGKLLKDNRKKVLAAFLFQLLLAAADSATLYAFFSGLGTSISFFFILLALISTKVISLIPFLPGSLILYESSMSFFFTALGVPVATAIIVTLLYRFLSFWLPMLPGLFFYRKFRKG